MPNKDSVKGSRRLSDKTFFLRRKGNKEIIEPWVPHLMLHVFIVQELQYLALTLGPGTVRLQSSSCGSLSVNVAVPELVDFIITPSNIIFLAFSNSRGVILRRFLTCQHPENILILNRVTFPIRNSPTILITNWGAWRSPVAC